MLQNSVQDYVGQLFDHNQMPLVRKVALAMIALFPDDEISYSNLGASYFFEENYEPAIEAFLKAHALNPQDGLILNNIGYLYQEMGDYKASLRYYEKMAKLEDPEAKAFAEERVKELKGKL